MGGCERRRGERESKGGRDVWVWRRKEGLVQAVCLVGGAARRCLLGRRAREPGRAEAEGGLRGVARGHAQAQRAALDVLAGLGLDGWMEEEMDRARS